MATRGRKPKPAAVKDLAGNPGKRNNVTDEDLERAAGSANAALELAAGGAADPGVVAGSVATPLPVPEAPDWLDDLGAAEWRRCVPELMRLKLFKVGLDEVSFASYCAHYSVFRASLLVVQAEGAMYETDSRWGNMRRMRPEFVAMRYAEKTMREIMAEFGLTPSSRWRIGGLAAAAPPPAPSPGGQGVLALEGGQAAENAADAGPLGFIRGSARLH